MRIASVHALPSPFALRNIHVQNKTRSPSAGLFIGRQSINRCTIRNRERGKSGRYLFNATRGKTRAYAREGKRLIRVIVRQRNIRKYDQRNSNACFQLSRKFFRGSRPGDELDFFDLTSRCTVIDSCGSLECSLEHLIIINVADNSASSRTTNVVHRHFTSRVSRLIIRAMSLQRFSRDYSRALPSKLNIFFSTLPSSRPLFRRA